MILSMRQIIGIDEVGRGCLAGPVLVTALYLPPKTSLSRRFLPKLRDSKKLSALEREKWFKFLKNHPKIFFATARVLPTSIDKINITKAANRAATKALKKLITKNQLPRTKVKVFLDGGLYINHSRTNIKPSTLNIRTIVRGDEKINAIKLASIVAKVTRDKYMVKIHKKYPAYGFDRHKGYGTLVHRRAIRLKGISPLHRKSFCTKFV